MSTTVNVNKASMRGSEIAALCKRHTLYEWSAQAGVEPIPVAGARGIYFWTPEGKRFIDFNSQLMSVNIGHGDPRVIEAIQQQAATLAYANPFLATEVRARLGAKLAEITPGDIDTFFFTNGGAEANENAIKLARFFTGRTRFWRVIAPITVLLQAAFPLPATRAAGQPSLAFPAWYTSSIRTTVLSADGTPPNKPWPVSRKLSSSKDRRLSRRSSWSL